MLQIIGFLLSGCFTGLLLSAPVGPANILCLEHTLKSGPAAGFIAGAGAAFGDFLFVIAALAGLMTVGDFQAENMRIMHYVGGSVLFLFGILSVFKGMSLYHHKNAHESLLVTHSAEISCEKTSKASIFSGFISNFILTVMNPLTPIGVFSAVAAVGLGGGLLVNNQFLAPLLFAMGVIIGSLGWWFGLTKIAVHFAKKLTRRSLCFVNYLGSVIMFSMGSYIFFDI
jgi:threonine/homoserine/homoserine lactone efflux protein